MRLGRNIPTKSALNLAMRENRKGNVRTLVIGCLLIAVLSGAVAKFGVIDQYARLNKAQGAYNEIHSTNQLLSGALKDFDKVQTDYRTHAMDWLEDTSVDRQQVLELLQEELMARGNVSSLTVYNQVMRVNMSGMNLSDISQMILSLEQRPIVASVALNLAHTDDDVSDDTGLLSFSLTILLQKEEAKQ